MYEFTDGMQEISGFGGEYEAMCRLMLKAGVEWLEAHPDADPKFHSFRDVTGVLMEDNEDAQALSTAIAAPSKGACTGAMHQACVYHCLFIKKNGWDEYVKRMSGAK